MTHQQPEIWKPLPGTKYEISDLGRVRSHCHSTPRILRPGLASHGYPTVAIGKGKTRCVHELVLLVFVGPPLPGQECRHKNGNRQDPRLVNLEYGTRSENIRDAVAHGSWHSEKRIAAWRSPAATARALHANRCRWQK